MKPRYSFISILLAIVIGAVAGWSLAPGMRLDRALQLIVDDDADVRRQGWARLVAGDGGVQPHLAEIIDRLETANDAALLDAAEHLRQARLWDWDRIPVEVVLREASLRAAGDESDREIAVRQMATCPLDLDQAEVMPILHRILLNADGRLLTQGKEAAFGWIGPHRFHSLRGLPLLEDEDTRRMVRLAVYWAQNRANRPPMERSWAHMDAEAATAHLQRGVTDDDGMVYAAVLLAEHSLPREDAVEVARQWIVDFDDDRKRAGALLAALLGEHVELLAEALEVATVPQVRTAQRLALLALGRPVGGDDDLEFAYRTLHLPGGHVNPDTLLCLLAAGIEDAPRYLASTPEEPTGDAIRARTLLIERFIPYWNIHAAVEYGEVDPAVAYYEAMRAVWMLTHRWMEFDEQVKQWRE